MNNETTELIDQYLLDQLDVPARQAVEERLRTDASFAAEVALQQSIIRQVRRLGQEELRQQLKAIAATAIPTAESDEASGERPVVPLRAAPRWWPYVAVAASLLLLIGLWFLNTNKPEPGVTGTVAERGTLATVPLIRSGQTPAMGFATETDTTALAILLYGGPAPQQYRFDDTLRLYGPFDPSQLMVLTNADSATYRLQIGRAVFPLERYQARQPLAD